MERIKIAKETIKKTNKMFRTQNEIEQLEKSK